MFFSIDKFILIGKAGIKLTLTFPGVFYETNIYSDQVRIIFISINLYFKKHRT